MNISSKKKIIKNKNKFNISQKNINFINKLVSIKKKNLY